VAPPGGLGPGADGGPGRGETQLQDLITPGTLTVGTELPAPPFGIGDDYDSLTGGFEVDVTKEMAKRLGLNQVKFVEMPFGALVAGSQCDCDIDFSQVTITPERDKVVDFTEPYFDANQGVLVKKGISVKSVDDAKKLQWGPDQHHRGQLPVRHHQAGQGDGDHARHPDRARRGREQAGPATGCSSSTSPSRPPCPRSPADAGQGGSAMEQFLETFFSRQDLKDSAPSVVEGFKTNLSLMFVAEAAVLVWGWCWPCAGWPSATSPCSGPSPGSCSST
jgi:extracellular solute-binding protein (family 3)